MKSFCIICGGYAKDIMCRRCAMDEKGGGVTLINEVMDVVSHARSKYPDSDLESRIDGFVQEAGEAQQALIKYKHNIGSAAHAREEVLQVMGQCVRLLEEAL